jgi:hypothetical protein
MTSISHISLVIGISIAMFNTLACIFAKEVKYWREKGGKFMYRVYQVFIEA